MIYPFFTYKQAYRKCKTEKYYFEFYIQAGLINSTEDQSNLRYYRKQFLLPKAPVFNKMMQSMIKFTTVRHPFDRMVSAYKAQ